MAQDFSDRLQQAAAQAAAGDYDQAIALLDAILAEQPGHAPALLLKGDTLRLAGAPAAAEACLAEAMRTGFPSVEIPLRLGLTRLDLGQTEAAESALVTAVRYAPADARPWHFLGLARYRAGRIEPAIEALETALRLDTSDEASRGLLMECRRLKPAEPTVRTLYYGMATMASSASYTVPALDSFFRHTMLGPQDRFLLIDNDGQFSLPERFAQVELIRNPAPMGFAQNVNQLFRLADPMGADLVFLNNDIVFTPNWLAPLLASDEAILIPLCNQYRLYESGALSLLPAMDLEDYLGKEEDFAAIAEQHKSDPTARGFTYDSHVSFYCFRVPRAIYRAIGYFDENFGRGGGEDVDYRVRAHLAGFQLYIAMESYLLHFMGKSTWRSGAAPDQRLASELTYFEYFCRKWGEPLARIFLFTRDWRAVAEQQGVAKMMEAGDYRRAIETLLARRAAV